MINVKRTLFKPAKYDPFKTLEKRVQDLELSNRKLRMEVYNLKLDMIQLRSTYPQINLKSSDILQGVDLDYKFTSDFRDPQEK